MGKKPHVPSVDHAAELSITTGFELELWFSFIE